MIKQHLFFLLLPIFFLVECAYPSSNGDTLLSSNLPVIVIHTTSSDTLTSNSSDVIGNMKIILPHNDTGGRVVKDSIGRIKISTRGKSSRSFPKLSFNIETQKNNGKNNNVSLLGMPQENDWVLYAPYTDKSLLRNYLVYSLFEKMGWYSPRSVYVELMLNNTYQGIYILMEKIKADPNRVNVLSKKHVNSANSLVEMTLKEHITEKDVSFTSKNTGYSFIIKYPKKKDITEANMDSITAVVHAFEREIYDKNFSIEHEAVQKLVNVNALIDFYLINESFRNPDGFKASTFFTIKEGRLNFGPVWDFNLAIGNYQYSEHIKTDGLGLLTSNWMEVILKDAAFRKKVHLRWEELRKTIFSDTAIHIMVRSVTDTLREAQKRNFKRWNILGKHIWPNPQQYIRNTYEEEVAQVKGWIIERFHHLDTAFIKENSYMVPIGKLVAKEIKYKGCESALTKYRALKQEAASSYIFSEAQLNSIGYELIRKKDYDCAIAVLRLNTMEYPTSANVYDSLAEAYMLNGDKELAISNYEKSLKIDPSNDNAKKNIATLVNER